MIPLKTSIAIDMKNAKQANLWAVAKQIYRENSKHINRISETDFEESTPGKHKDIKTFLMNFAKCFLKMNIWEEFF